jgi:hypothetical protein
MKLFKATAAVAATLIFAAAPLQAQQKRVSPHETVSAVIDGNRVTVTYGRPYSKNPKTGEIRKIWGGLVPFGKAWRMGSDEATSLITQQPLMFGETTLPVGVYTLYFVPNEDGTAKLAFSSTLGAWGVPVNEKTDVIRVDAIKSDSAADSDQFTMTVEKGRTGGGIIKLSWEKTTYTVPFTVKK